MALQFYFGPSGSGKSKRLHQDVLHMAAKDPDCNFLFLVPDQFTMQTQMDLVKESPGGGIMNIDVLSFGRLAYRIFEETGKGNTPVLDDEGKKYADVEITPDVRSARGSIYAMTLEETPMTLVFRAQQTSTLIPSSAVHGTGDDRYVFTVETSYSNFGGSRMTVRKTPVTVLGEAGGVASVQEDLGYYEIAYMEDRPINDGDAVMLYAD